MAARRGRPPNVQLSAEHRSKIKASLIINALQEHTLGSRKMSQTQITAGVALLRKCLPDLNSTSVTGDPNNPIEHRVIITGVRRASDLEPPRPLTIEALANQSNGTSINDH
jgi:hypothetical protein